MKIVILDGRALSNVITIKIGQLAVLFSKKVGEL